MRKRDHLEDPGIVERILLRWTFRKWDGGAWSGLIWLRTGTGVGYLKCGDEPLGSIKCREFLD
jgi:hypothetical protein